MLLRAEDRPTLPIGDAHDVSAFAAMPLAIVGHFDFLVAQRFPHVVEHGELRFLHFALLRREVANEEIGPCGRHHDERESQEEPFHQSPLYRKLGRRRKPEVAEPPAPCR